MKDAVTWADEGKPCKARGCKKPMRSSVKASPQVYIVGPQGGWVCADGHQGWIWPPECSCVPR